MTIGEFRISRAKLEHLHAEAREARRANAANRLRFAAWLHSVADRIATS